MEWTGLNELREKFLSFFESKGHLRLPSYPLVPKDDKSLLLINSGMAPMKKFFTGEVTPPRKRVTTCQKCIRTPDIERVGITARHGTFLKCSATFRSAITLKATRPPGPGNSLQRYWRCRRISFMSLFLKTTTRHMISGQNRSAFPPTIWYALGKRTTFGSMAPDRAGRALKSILTGERTRAAVSPAARSAATATAM